MYTLDRPLISPSLNDTPHTHTTSVSPLRGCWCPPFWFKARHPRRWVEVFGRPRGGGVVQEVRGSWFAVFFLCTGPGRAMCHKIRIMYIHTSLPCLPLGGCGKPSPVVAVGIFICLFSTTAILKQNKESKEETSPPPESIYSTILVGCEKLFLRVVYT